jgi:ATP-dependent Lon protease
MTNAAERSLVVLQKKNREDRSTKDDIHSVGTVARILRVLKCPTEQLVILQGKTI